MFRCFIRILSKSLRYMEAGVLTIKKINEEVKKITIFPKVSPSIKQAYNPCEQQKYNIMEVWKTQFHQLIN